MLMPAELKCGRSAGEESAMRLGIKDLVDSGLHAVPPAYVRLPHDRPDALLLSGQAPAHLQFSIPVIDLAHLLHEPDDASAAAARTTLIQQLGCACQEWGFFQVINHGIEVAVIQRLREAALKFFMQPAQERMSLFSEDISRPIYYGTSFNAAQEKVREWKDILSLKRVPGFCDGFQEAPDICKKEMQEYIEEVEALAKKVHRAIFESTGLQKEYIEREVPMLVQAVMNVNYYPPCPDPTLTLGLSAHSDVSCLTILDPGDVPGLHIKHKGIWVPIFPVNPSALVINLADQIEITKKPVTGLVGSRSG